MGTVLSGALVAAGGATTLGLRTTFLACAALSLTALAVLALSARTPRASHP